MRWRKRVHPRAAGYGKQPETRAAETAPSAYPPALEEPIPEAVRPIARRRTAAPKVKRHPAEKLRSKHLFKERWTNAQAARIGQMVGQGATSVAIAEEIGGGVIPATVRGIAKKWQLKLAHGLIVELTPYEKSRLAKKARKQGLTIEEFCRRFLAVCARDDLYRAVVGDAFD